MSRLTIEFEPLAGSGPEHPSPGRVLGALLAGVHRSGDAAALEAVGALSRLAQPMIAFPRRQALFSHVAASTSNPALGWDIEASKMREVTKITGAAGESLIKLDTMTPGRASGKDLIERRRELVHGAYRFYAQDPDDTVDRRALAVAAEHVSHFGGGADLALCRITDAEPAAGSRVWRQVVESGVGKQLRIWSPGLIDWYDDQYEAIHGAVALRTSMLTDRRVLTAGWLPGSHATAGDRVVLAVAGRGRSQRSLPAMLAQISGTDQALPMIDGRGLVRGISVPAGDRFTLSPGCSWFQEQGSELLTCEPASWVGTGRRQAWVNATAVSAHADERVARWEIEKSLPAGSVLVELRDAPFHPRHTGELKPIPVPAGNRRWWVRVEAAWPSEMVVGSGASEGCGLMRPLGSSRQK